jgi:hypothetical protein
MQTRHPLLGCLVLAFGWLCTPSCNGKECEPGDQPDNCTADRNSTWSCTQSSGTNTIHTEPCPPSRPTCYYGHCYKLTPQQKEASQGIGPFAMPCEEDCGRQKKAGCRDADDLFAKCMQWCANQRVSVPPQCVDILHKSYECGLVAGDLIYRCNDDGHTVYGYPDATSPSVCVDLYRECSDCAGTGCSSYLDNNPGKSALASGGGGQGGAGAAGQGAGGQSGGGQAGAGAGGQSAGGQAGAGGQGGS